MVIRCLLIASPLVLLSLPTVSLELVTPVEVTPDNADEYSISVFMLDEKSNCEGSLEIWVRLPEVVTKADLRVIQQDHGTSFAASLALSEEPAAPYLAENIPEWHFISEDFYGVAFCIQPSELSRVKLFLSNPNPNGSSPRLWVLSSLDRWRK